MKNEASNITDLTWRRVVSGQAGVESQGAPLRGSVEQRHCGVRQHGRVAAGDQLTRGRRARPHAGAVAQPATCQMSSIGVIIVELFPPGGVAPEDVSRVAVVGRPAAVHVAPAEI